MCCIVSLSSQKDEEQRFGPTHFPPLMHMGTQIPGEKGMKFYSLNINSFAVWYVRFTCSWQAYLVVSYFFGISYQCILQNRCTHYFSCSDHIFTGRLAESWKNTWQQSVTIIYSIIIYHMLHYVCVIYGDIRQGNELVKYKITTASC